MGEVPLPFASRKEQAGQTMLFLFFSSVYILLCVVVWSGVPLQNVPKAANKVNDLIVLD